MYEVPLLDDAQPNVVYLQFTFLQLPAETDGVFQ